ncbi:hypothetical protein HMPREF3188_00652 [Tissierellia bacterium KA00581]|jgi:hypothetical protein|nr:hypothetical protein HMPREF3188_00652 [Tissierellia bacterium KA00581]
MLKMLQNRVNQVQMVSIDSLVPKNHLLRKIDETIDFPFIYDLIEDKYCLDNETKYISNSAF